MRTTPIYFPSQKISTGKKTFQWYKECLDAAEALCILRENAGHNYHHKMQIWEDLDNDIIDENEIERVFNPMKLQDAVFKEVAQYLGINRQIREDETPNNIAGN